MTWLIPEARLRAQIPYHLTTEDERKSSAKGSCTGSEVEPVWWRERGGVGRWEGRKSQRISNVPVLCKEHANNPSTLHYHSALRVFQQVQEGGALQRRPSEMKKTPQPPTLARTPLGWGEGQTGPTNGLMIHRWALVCANWLCWPPDSWQGAGLWGTPVSLPLLPPRMAA